MPRQLVIGIGNPGRGDDGLGPALAEAIRAEAIAGVEVEVDYQLAIEHAAWIAEVDTVWFVDASIEAGDAPYVCRRLRPRPGLDFTSHVLEPGRVLALADELYGCRPEAWLFTVVGESFEMFEQELSVVAAARLADARGELAGCLRRCKAQ